MPKIHYGIDETITYQRFSFIDSSYQIEISDVKGDNAGSDRIIIKKEHLAEFIEVLTKIQNYGIDKLDMNNDNHGC